jgi:hypothetical protein
MGTRMAQDFPLGTRLAVRGVTRTRARGGVWISEDRRWRDLLDADMDRFFASGEASVEPATVRPPACPNPFNHLPYAADTLDQPCGHQYDIRPCGCVLADDHDSEDCDGMSVAELEDSHA